jgi:hypothetical protein
VNGRQKITVMIPTQIVATRFIHLYFGPLVHGPALNASPIRQRR